MVAVALGYCRSLLLSLVVTVALGRLLSPFVTVACRYFLPQLVSVALGCSLSFMITHCRSFSWFTEMFAEVIQSQAHTFSLIVASNVYYRCVEIVVCGCIVGEICINSILLHFNIH